MWLCGYVAMLGYMAMWLCGYVDKFQNFKFLNFKDPKSWVHTWSRIFEIFESQISKDKMFPRCSHILSPPLPPAHAPLLPTRPGLLVDLQPAIQFYSDFSCGSSLSLSPSLPPSLPSPSLLVLASLPPSLTSGRITVNSDTLGTQGAGSL